MNLEIVVLKIIESGFTNIDTLTSFNLQTLKC